MKTGLVGALLGAIIGGVLAGMTLVLVLIPIGALIGAIVGFFIMTALSIGNADERARCGYHVVCPSTSELVTVKLNPERARWGEIVGGPQEVTGCSGHWNGPPACGYPCVCQVADEQKSGTDACTRKHWEMQVAQDCAYIEGFGRTLEEAFEEAALAVTAVTIAPNHIRRSETLTFTCQGKDTEALFQEWIATVIRESHVRAMLFRDFSVQIKGEELTATVKGEHISACRWAPAGDVKDIVPDSANIAQEPDGSWLTHCNVQVQTKPKEQPAWNK